MTFPAAAAVLAIILATASISHAQLQDLTVASTGTPVVASDAGQQEAGSQNTTQRTYAEDRVNAFIQKQPTLDSCTDQSFIPFYLGDRPRLPKRPASQNANTNTLERKQYLPNTIHTRYAGPAHNEPLAQFHWIFTSCDRRFWGRTVSSTLISGLTNDLYPTTINILWCRSYNSSDVPPLLYNMRHSHQVNLFYMSPELEAVKVTHVVKVLISALLIPCALGMPQIPILYTEDDILFAPDANARLYKALASMSDQQLSETFALSLYSPGRIEPTPEQETGVQQPGDDENNAAAAHNTNQSLDPNYWFGIQGAFFSPSLVPRLLDQYYKILDGRARDPVGAWQDLIVFELLKYTWRCNQPGSGCHLAVVNPSLVQHIGTTSAVFMKDGRNQRYHAAADFPVRVRFPGYESHERWL